MTQYDPIAMRAIGIFVFLAPIAAHAAVRNVGPGVAYATPCAAIAAAQANDEVDVAPGTYTDSCSITAPGLSVRGVSGWPKIDLSGTDHH